MIAMKRAYEPADASDGYRVLVERLWPRGVSKEHARLDAWAKDIAPSPELRSWYAHDAARWAEFQRRYEAELRAAEAQPVLDDLARRAQRGRVTLVYAARDGEMSSTAVVRRVLEGRVARGR